MTQIITIANGKLTGMTSNPDLTLAELKAIKEVNGAVVFKVTDAQFTKVEAGYDVDVSSGSVVLTKGAEVSRRIAEKTKQENDKIYLEIGKKEQIKLGKISSGVATTEEDSAITKLKAKLK